MKREDFLASMRCNTYESEVSGLYYIDFDEERQVLFAGAASNSGISREIEVVYDDGLSLDENLNELIDAISDEDNLYREFDNVTNRDLPKYNGRFYMVSVPYYCLPYLVNRDTEGYSEEDIAKMKAFEEEYDGKLINNASVGDFCVPLDCASPSFMAYNDVYGWLGCDCYRFLLPSKVEVEHLSI